MGDLIPGMGNGGSGGKRVVNAKATANAQNASNDAARNKFTQNYNALFGQGATNQGFTDSLRGYYGGATLQDIAQKLAQTNAYQTPVRNVFKTVGDGSGGSGGIMGMLDPLGLSKGPQGMMGGQQGMMPPMPNFNIF